MLEAGTFHCPEARPMLEAGTSLTYGLCTVHLARSLPMLAVVM
jgi:hypothetical protein